MVYKKAASGHFMEKGGNATDINLKLYNSLIWKTHIDAAMFSREVAQDNKFQILSYINRSFS